MRLTFILATRLKTRQDVLGRPLYLRTEAIPRMRKSWALAQDGWRVESGFGWLKEAKLLTFWPTPLDGQNDLNASLGPSLG
ncbi:MAG: hypothetical protein LBJ64_05775 [Deltaproteobacteria bacterium]|nr:hypothetical protein [Deltaproteobacteria bacterium]